MTNELLAENKLLKRKCEAYEKAIEDIKAEIKECWRMYEDKFDVSDCLDIIDKHISGKESE